MKPRRAIQPGDEFTRDPALRVALLKELRRKRVLRGGTVAVQELGLRRSDAIVDVAVVNGSLCGFEIKSEVDTLRRLARQAEVYGQVLDRVTLIVGQHHLGAARRLVPSWWGLMAARTRADGPTLTTVRSGRDNPTRNARALAELLWLDEARAMLAKRDALRGYKTKPRDLVWDRLCEVYSLDEIAAAVRQQLKARAASGVLRRLS